MALPTLEQRIPTTVETVLITLASILLKDPDTGEFTTEDYKKAHFSLGVYDQDGRQMQVASISGDLLPHLSPEQVAWLTQFMDDMRVLAEAALPIST